MTSYQASSDPPQPQPITNALSSVAGKFLGIEEMVTSRIALDDVATRGFEELIQNKDHHIKILVTPRPELLNV